MCIHPFPFPNSLRSRPLMEEKNPLPEGQIKNYRVSDFFLKISGSTFFPISKHSAGPYTSRQRKSFVLRKDNQFGAGDRNCLIKSDILLPFLLYGRPKYQDDNIPVFKTSVMDTISEFPTYKSSRVN